MDCDGKLEGTLRFSVATLMGTSRIWTSFSHLLIRSDSVCVGRDGCVFYSYHFQYSHIYRDNTSIIVCLFFLVGEKSSPTMTPVKRWVRRTNLVDSRTSVTDVKFAPKNQGLLLATSSVDGTIRIYEAPDIMNLSQWTLQHEIPCKLPLSCLSWNQSMFRLHTPMIAVSL